MLSPTDLAPSVIVTTRGILVSRGGGEGKGREQQLDSRLRTSENAITTSE